jgi:hypothetical protein
MPATKQRQVYRLFNEYTLEYLSKRLIYKISYLDAIRRSVHNGRTDKNSERFKEMASRILNQPCEELFVIEDEKDNR